MNHEVIIDGKTYVPKETRTETPGVGLFRVTVERIFYDGRLPAGIHQAHVVAGSWSDALKYAASCATWFTHKRRDQA